MSTAATTSVLRRHSVLAYFILTFFISWLGAFAVVVPSLIRRQAIAQTIGLIIFPAMLLGPSLSAVLLTWLTDGKDGLNNLAAELRLGRVAPKWYALLLLPPAVILAVLFSLKLMISPAFSPNHFYIGILFGLPAGILEEIGWSGYAYPRMTLKWNPLVSAIVLGLLWSLWHLPAVNFLGASAPHGRYWLQFFLAFGLAMTAMRVLICWQYSNTNRLVLAQLMHISSTGSLVALSPPAPPSQEAMWYAIYGCALWAIAGVVIKASGINFRRSGSKPAASG